MKFDIFFSISQTPVSGQNEGQAPSEKVMFDNFFDQVRAADEMGYETAWVAESHLSSEVQKHNPKPVIPHWKGEVGLNTDILQLAHYVFAKTKRIEVGSAVMNLFCNGGPVAHAERLATFACLHGLLESETRRLHLGFAAGRFDFSSRATGVKPRNAAEDFAWPVVKGKIFQEASETFVRLFQGETISSEDVSQLVISREDFRSDSEWLTFCEKMGKAQDQYQLPRFWNFEKIKIVPQEFRSSLVQLVIGSHDPKLQSFINKFAPVQVFNLSITKPEIIEKTHERMNRDYNPKGGPWRRDYMPRTVFVFLDEDEKTAQKEAALALGAYWTALEGTLDLRKVQNAADNALVGNPETVAQQIQQRFHPDDRLMLWFDFFNHDNARVIHKMELFMKKVVPLIKIEKKLRSL